MNFASRLSSVAVTLALAALASGLVACGPSYADKQKEAEATREAERERFSRERQDRFALAGAKFGAVEFPGKDLPGAPFTLELQRFLDRHSGKPLVFEAFIQDVEQTNAGPVITLERPIGRDIIGDVPVVVFRLKATPEAIERVLTMRREFNLGRRYRFLRHVDALAIARVEAIHSAKRYEVRAWSAGQDHAEASIESLPYFLAEGRLLDIILFASESSRPEAAR